MPVEIDSISADNVENVDTSNVVNHVEGIQQVLLGLPLLVAYVLDSSGSMNTQAVGVRSGFNEYIESLQRDYTENPTFGDIRMTLISFNSVVRTLYNDRQILDVPLLTEQNYTPNGGTALNDAVGQAIELLDEVSGTGTTSRVLLVIQTDGLENASSRYSKGQIFSLLTERQARGNWTVVFMGANIDAFSEGARIGLIKQNVSQYTAHTVLEAMADITEGTRSLRNSMDLSSANFYAGKSNTNPDPDNPLDNNINDFSDFLNAARAIKVESSEPPLESKSSKDSNVILDAGEILVAPDLESNVNNVNNRTDKTNSIDPKSKSKKRSSKKKKSST